MSTAKFKTSKQSVHSKQVKKLLFQQYGCLWQFLNPTATMKQKATSDIATPLALAANSVAIVKNVEWASMKPNPTILLRYQSNKYIPNVTNIIFAKTAL
jgi:hypothetical protein